MRFVGVESLRKSLTIACAGIIRIRSYGFKISAAIAAPRGFSSK